MACGTDTLIYILNLTKSSLLASVIPKLTGSLLMLTGISFPPL